MKIISKEILNSAQNSYKKLAGLCETLQKRPAYDFCTKNVCLKEVLLRDTIDYLLCLAACDGGVSENEADAIKHITGTEMQFDDLNRRIIDKNLFSGDFYCKVPQILRITVAADQPFLGLGGIYDNAYFSNFVLKFFRLSGDIVISVDNDITFEEKNIYRSYIYTMRDYLQSNCPI